VVFLSSFSLTHLLTSTLIYKLSHIHSHSFLSHSLSHFPFPSRPPSLPFNHPPSLPPSLSHLPSLPLSLNLASSLSHPPFLPPSFLPPPDVVFFDESIDAKLNRYMFKFRNIDTPFLLDNANLHAKTYVPPTANTVGLVDYGKDGRVYEYERFPALE
jgi:hypothetical protein